ncbi:MAG: hypothetical protein EPO02_01995 [Nitrospirae bacterium]|nr:MAG: hypothetical protein EPO02_01995 [Nitrospirota bacterium]
MTPARLFLILIASAIAGSIVILNRYTDRLQAPSVTYTAPNAPNHVSLVSAPHPVLAPVAPLTMAPSPTPERLPEPPAERDLIGVHGQASPPPPEPQLPSGWNETVIPREMPEVAIGNSTYEDAVMTFRSPAGSIPLVAAPMGRIVDRLAAGRYTYTLTHLGRVTQSGSFVCRKYRLYRIVIAYVPMAPPAIRDLGD